MMQGTRIVDRDLMKSHSQTIENSAAIWPWRKSQMLTTIMQKKFWEYFEIKNLVKYNYLYVQNDTVLPENKFERFRNKCIEIYQLDPTHFLSVPRLSFQTFLKMT